MYNRNVYATFDQNLINYNVPIEQRYVFNDLRLVDEKEIHMPL